MKKKAFLSGDYTNPTQHPFNGVDSVLKDIFDPVYDIDCVSEHFESFSYDTLSRFDCMILYTDHWIDKSQTVPLLVPNFVSYIVNGGALLLLHNFDIIYDYEMAQIVGVHSSDSSDLSFFKFFPSSKDVNDVTDAPCHPILNGIDPFSFEDEVHSFVFNTFSKVEPLLTAQTENRTLPAAWCQEFGCGRVVSVAAGHGEEPYKNPIFKTFLRQSAMWLNKTI